MLFPGDAVASQFEVLNPERLEKEKAILHPNNLINEKFWPQ
jgi:hypothetical protein